MSNNNKLISVFGATGAQGGAVIKALIKSGYKTRAFTRNIDSSSALELKKSGAEVVKLDLEQPEADIVQGLTGSYGVFLLTNYWTIFEKEEAFGKKAADAAVKSGIKHIVFSGLSPVNKISNGKISVPHFDLKYKVEEHIRSLSKENPLFISTFVYAPFYMQNFNTFFIPKKNEETGEYTISLPQDPTVPLDLGDVSDIGPIVSGIFDNPSIYSGSVIPFSGSVLTGPEIAEVFSKQTSKVVKYNYIPTAVFATFPFPGAVELAANFEFYNVHGAFYGQDKSIAKSITSLTSFEEYLKKSNYSL